jgi:hypothetical protein
MAVGAVAELPLALSLGPGRSIIPRDQGMRLARPMLIAGPPGEIKPASAVKVVPSPSCPFSCPQT